MTNLKDNLMTMIHINNNLLNNLTNYMITDDFKSYLKISTIIRLKNKLLTVQLLQLFIIFIYWYLLKLLRHYKVT